MGRKPDEKSMGDLEQALTRKIDEAIRSEAGESASSIYRRFGLEQRGIHLRTFMRYVRMVRSIEWTDAIKPPPPSMEKIREELLISIYESAQAGGMKAYEMAALLARVQEHDRIEIQKAADKRAGELHESKLKALRAKLEEAIKQDAGAGETQSSKDLQTILEKVAAGELSVFDATKQIGDVLWIEIDKQMRGAA